MPIFISFATILHIILLHQFGSSNPLHSGNIKEIIKFHPYFKVKDILGIIIVSTSLSELTKYRNRIN